MRVVRPTPETGTLRLALATAVIRVPFLAPKALANVAGEAPISWFVMRRLASMVREAKEDAFPEDSFLSLLIFKSYKNPPDFGLSPLVQKPNEIGHLEIISVFNLSFEIVIILL